ncbi:hypothetical protein AMJ50_02445 [Parcubacteria bacterium DG_74_3]|nr:MAG: hypothetical protein AMJ50_02445 [Parcubacteria bacterium DG_74_3]
MKIFNEIFLNQSLAAALIAWFIAQSLKFFTNIIQNREVDFRLLIATGGFPSSHSAVVSALATSVGLNFGFDSPLFALSAIFAGVVISDARGIRQSAGKQAEVLNKIIEDLYQKRAVKIERLKEFLGHTSLEVFYGVLLGILVAVLLVIY